MAFWKKRGKAGKDTSEDTIAEEVPEVDDTTPAEPDTEAEEKADAETEAEPAEAEPAADADDKDSAGKDSDAAEDSDKDESDKDDADESAEKDDSAEKDSDDSAEKDADDSAESADEDDESERTDEIDDFWEKAEIDPVEISFPSGTGFTLRHYRTVTDEDDEEAEEAVFLAHDQKLQMFRSAEDLVEYVKSDAEHDLRELETYAEMAESLTVERVVVDEEDEYGLDLVVQNLRGGHDAWDQDLLIGAGEVTRDIAFACQLDDVLTALAPGSPLDDLDEALRANGFLARRKMRKISPERAAIAWRSLISKVDAVVEWHGEIPEDDEDEDDESAEADTTDTDETTDSDETSETASEDDDTKDDDTKDAAEAEKPAARKRRSRK
ncbi:hypothetical protein [Fodinicola acaciae]|uniref:hypothetical protein n=1 Tax=Fodinicola acaciae TaxID=2681555 RepID=UPI001C9E6DC5|nr:hypothetical protein [Fodinicola acaciae]